LNDYFELCKRLNHCADWYYRMDLETRRFLGVYDLDPAMAIADIGIAPRR
jgi:hypothetical protein